MRIAHCQRDSFVWVVATSDEVVEVIALGWSLLAKDVHGVETRGAHRRQ